ncbi:MAG: TolC family protein [Mucilaginibacter sp.]|uniref:TolC family protein n=1 Tax=Mucilaginibacter sp. TaxID=1882438 RepID=UPI0031A78712
MQRHALIIPLIVFFSLSYFTLQGQSLSLHEVWQHVDSKDKTNLIKQIQVNQSKENILDARAERLPEINLAGYLEETTNLPIYENGLFNSPSQHAIVHTRYKVGADAYFNIYNGGKTNIKIAERKIMLQLTDVQQKQTAANLRLLAAVYYLDLSKSYVFRALMINDIADQEKQLKKVKVLLKEGVILKSDMLRIELKLSRQRVTLLQIENDIKIAAQKLNIMMGEADEQTIIPADSLNVDQLPMKTYPEYLAEASSEAYEYRIAKQETGLSDLKLKDVRANSSVKAGIYSSFAYAYPENFLYPYAADLYSLGITGVKISFPISSFYTNRHKVKTAKLEHWQKQVETADVQDKIRQRVNEAFLRYQEATTKVDVAKTDVVRAVENYRIVRNTYFNQTSLITDLLDADVQLLQARFDLAAAQVTAHLQYYQLQNTIGRL